MAELDSTNDPDRFKLLFENSFEAMMIFEQAGKILEVNQQMAELVGYRVEDMIGKSVYEFMLPIEREDAVDRTQKASEGQPLPMVERTIVRKDGSRFIGEANLSPIMDEDGNEIGVVTSGGFGPSAEGPFAMGYVATSHAKAGTPVQLEVRGKLHAARTVKMPFVPHRYYRGS